MERQRRTRTRAVMFYLTDIEYAALAKASEPHQGFLARTARFMVLNALKDSLAPSNEI